MTQPLAVLNDEEMHWLDDLGLPNQRRWLNHRNSVTNTAERFPPPPRIVAHLRLFVPFVAYFFCAFLWLTQGELAGAALLVFEARSHFQEPVEHLRAFRAPCGEL